MFSGSNCSQIHNIEVSFTRGYTSNKYFEKSVSCHYLKILLLRNDLNLKHSYQGYIILLIFSNEKYFKFFFVVANTFRI